MPPDENGVERRVEMVKILTEIKGEIKSHGEKIDANTTLTGKILKTLHGNDGNGLVTRVKLLESNVEGNEDAIKDHRNAHKWWRQNVARCGIGAVGLGLISAIVYLIRATG